MHLFEFRIREIPVHRPNSAGLTSHDGDRRDQFVDGWRGLFHLILMVDHLPFLLPAASMAFSQWFEPLGYVSVAEGFVFLSGFVSGLVYTRVLRGHGCQAVWRKVFKRILTIYACYVSAVVLLVAVAKSCGPCSIQWGAWQNLLDMPLMVAALKVALLVYQPNFLEILPMYCLFLLSVPVAIRELEKGRYLTIARISILIWLAAQLGIRSALVGILSPWVTLQTGYFNAFGWQIVFVLGLLCGHKTFACPVAWLPANWKWTTYAYILFLLLFSLRHQVLPVTVWQPLVDRSSLGPLRFLDFTCVAFLVSSLRDPLQKFITWPVLTFLSKHSLQVFAFHLFPIYLTALALSGAATYSLPGQWLVTLGLAGAAPLSLLGQSLVMAFCLASLCLIAVLAKNLKAFYKAFLARCRNRRGFI
ncbi:MAG: OpgC domain-containing protein [Verrucomicrobiae bacterium]|nr:OpgC domain-containing protein [Verrucomicrobiae bacterium]